MQRRLVLFVIIGFVSLVFSLAVLKSAGIAADQVVYMPLILRNASVQPSSKGNVSGYVRDIRTKERLAGATVCFEDTICTQTDSNGEYLLQNIPSGSAEFTAQLYGYSDGTERKYVQPIINTDLNFELLPILDEGEIRVVLSWDETPSWPPEFWPNDLNLHLWTNYDEPYHHVYIGNTGNCADMEVLPYACYELDEQYGSGPDSIVLADHNGDYAIGVLNYYDGRTGVPPLSTINARVQVFDTTGLVRDFQVPPTGDGDLWMVFNLSFGAYEPQNCLVQYILPGDYPPGCP